MLISERFQNFLMVQSSIGPSEAPLSRESFRKIAAKYPQMNNLQCYLYASNSNKLQMNCNGWCHEILIGKMEHYGVRGVAFE